MRRNSIIKIHRQADGAPTRDDLGRSLQTADEGIQIKCALLSVRYMSNPDPATAQGDAVAFLPAKLAPDPVHLDSWVEVTQSKTKIALGSYSIIGVSGGRRILRLILKRVDARDRTHGPL